MKKTNCIIKDNKNLSINPVLFPHRYLLALCVFLLLFFTAGCGKKEPVTDFVPEEGYLRQSSFLDFDISSLNTIPNNPNPTLSVPTYITKIGDTISLWIATIIRLFTMTTCLTRFMNGRS